VSAFGRDVPVWRGVQTFVLDGGAEPIATLAGRPCGYARRHGRGRALLLGTWPVADSVTGRIGDVLDIEDAPTADGQPPQKTIVFDYTNERRGGEVISGGTLAHWDGENVTATGPEINTATGEPIGPPVPTRPIGAAHRALARALHGRAPDCVASDRHAQARVLQARAGGAATVSVVNRYEIDVACSIRTRNAGRAARLPLEGKLRLPAGTAMLLPLDYDLGGGVVVEQATVQLVEAEVEQRRARFVVTSPAGGELVLRLPGRPRLTKVDVAPGRQSVDVAWRPPSASRRSRPDTGRGR
jgi:hypothetical protein